MHNFLGLVAYSRYVMADNSLWTLLIMEQDLQADNLK